MNKIKSLQKEVRDNADKKRVLILKRFFKTGKGEYGEGDMFLGLPVPVSIMISKKYVDLGFSDLQKLLNSKIHEERMIVLSILTKQYAKSDALKQEKIFKFYLKNTRHINNWDLVDLSAYKIIGPYLQGKNKDILVKLAKSKSIWEKRIAIISTFHYIKQGKAKEALKIAEALVNDRQDLIQKAVGWMLREVGKRCGQETEEKFLRKHYKTMPRTMLRYSIERFPKDKKNFYMGRSIG